MRRSITMIVATMAALGLVLAGPVGAAPAEKTTYEFFECFTVFGEPDRSWFSGKDDKNWHVRGAGNQADEYRWDDNDEVWANVGSNATVVNWNVRWMLVGPPDAPMPVPTAGTLWGTFDFESDIGDFSGHWTWAGWPDAEGKGSGKSDSGQIAKVTLLNEDPGFAGGDFLPVCGFDATFVVLEVIDPRT